MARLRSARDIENRLQNLVPRVETGYYLYALCEYSEQRFLLQEWIFDMRYYIRQGRYEDRGAAQRKLMTLERVFDGLEQRHDTFEKKGVSRGWLGMRS